MKKSAMNNARNAKAGSLAKKPSIMHEDSRAKKSNSKPAHASSKLVIDYTPSWESLVQLFIEWIQSGNSEQHTEATENLFRIAKIADAYRENQSLFEVSGEMYEALKKMLDAYARTITGAKMGFEIIAIKKAEQALAKADGKLK